MRISVSVGIGGGGKPAPRSLAQFTSGPTLTEIIEEFNIEFGEEKIRFFALPPVAVPVVTFGVEKITVEG